MSPSADQLTAFQSESGFTPSGCATLLIGGVFAVLLLWGVWAMRTAYVGWSEQRISQRQFVVVTVRFAAIYVVLTFLLLS
jgi:integrating conjugative element protein (TIGR03758 family)